MITKKTSSIGAQILLIKMISSICRKIALTLSILGISHLSEAQQTIGLFTQEPGSLDGYVLFAPLASDTTYLIDKCGYKVHTWTSAYTPGQSVYLLEDGNLLHSGSANNSVFVNGGNGGILELLDWNSNVLWNYAISTTTQCQHHDILRLPNGNILAIVWEFKPHPQAIAAGRDTALLGGPLWPDKIVEVQPIGTDSAAIVWEWHAWDHLIQEYDATKNNYGVVADHPELINLNFVPGAPRAADWLHSNALAYNEELDQVMLSVHNFSEIWIIDHSTTTAEAASHAGGLHGQGGDLLYRWGNPQAYNRGNALNKRLYSQHNAHWIPAGLPDEGNVIVFNNGLNRPGGNYSSVDIFQLPVDSAGNYTLLPNQAYGPNAAYWSYTAPVQTDFYSSNISGAQRLSNGNTLICEGDQGNFFEVDANDSIVWRYVNPVSQQGILSQGTTTNSNPVFRCTLYEPSYAGLAGHTLTPAGPIELNPLPYNCNMLTGVGEKNLQSSLSVVNPFNSSLVLTSYSGISDADLTLCDVSGRCILQFGEVNLGANIPTSFQLNSDLPSGIYFLKVQSSKQNLVVKLVHARD